MNDRLNVRPTRVEDAAAVAPLLDQLGYPSTPEDVRERFAAILPQPDDRAWVAELEGEVIGFAGACVGRFFEKNTAYGHLLALVIDERCVGQERERRCCA